MKTKFFAAVVGALVMVSCGMERDRVNTSSDLHALFAESSIQDLKFGIEGNKVYLVEGNTPLAWAHAAPTMAGNKIRFKGKDIGNISTGYFCNGPYDQVCDASLYKSRASSISMKNLNSGSRQAKNPADIKLITANTKQLGAFKVSNPVNGKAKGSCQVKTDKGTKKLSITVEQKKAKDNNGNVVQMLEVKTPVYQYNAQAKTANFVEMKTLQRVFANGTVQNVKGQAAQKSSEVQGLLRLFR